jgi:hypothetical protein
MHIADSPPTSTGPTVNFWGDELISLASPEFAISVKSPSMNGDGGTENTAAV